jgi:D-alanyl-D-alanine carboxypeptidase
MIINQDLKNYIQARLQEGWPLDHIQKALIESGWNTRDIDNTLEHISQTASKRKISLKKIVSMAIPTPLAAILLFSLIIISIVIFIFFRNPIYKYDISLAATSPSQTIPFSYGEQPALSNPIFFQKIKQGFIEQGVDFISVDLSAMTVEVYKDGKIQLEVPIKTKGRPGSWWETPAGLYKIDNKEPSHFSQMGHVYMPWSMDFQGNFFIHGWPYYENGTPVATTYSGGCIRLATDDAKKLYGLVDIGMPILIFENSFTPDNFVYANNPQGISGASYIAGDLNNNFIFLGKNSDQSLPIASLTKLMTALVATEYINLDTTTTVPKEAIVYTSKPRLIPGEKVTIYQLLFPLLMESSNEAAETIARDYGRDDFIKRMNDKATSIGMTDTKFVDPSGAGAGNTSTAQDLFTLAKYIYNNRSFILDITSGQIKDSAYGTDPFSNIENFNGFTDDPRFVGGKVGKTSAAKETQLSIFNVPIMTDDTTSTASTTRPIILITLGSDDSTTDISNMLNYVQNNFEESR